MSTCCPRFGTPVFDTTSGLFAKARAMRGSWSGIRSPSRCGRVYDRAPLRGGGGSSPPPPEFLEAPEAPKKILGLN